VRPRGSMSSERATAGAGADAAAGARGARAVRARPALPDDQKQEIVEAFNLFDSEKRGYLDLQELKVRAGAVAAAVARAARRRRRRRPFLPLRRRRPPLSLRRRWPCARWASP